MTAYRIKWKTPEASGVVTGTFPNQAVAMTFDEAKGYCK